ncbi:MAG TPA: Type 1 glutamine amidotransferase-like domain-containing protein [Candidatus Saccharimonadales bacterium]|nr:Type 1 glutamine amidotransferase-like domain-containing protein [Candidatus Saccharimonadales bacterium]
MRTRIILHGGNSDRSTEKNAKFFKEIVDGVGTNTVKVLCVYFARPEHRWDDSYEEDKYIFQRIDTDKDVETELATYDSFVDQIAAADIVFINGGHRGHLKETLLSIGVERFRQMVEGKTLVGISAGANILSKYYYSSVAQDIREGTNFLNIKLFTHFSEDEPEQLNDLKSYAEDLPVVTIPEEEYLVIE